MMHSSSPENLEKIYGSLVLVGPKPLLHLLSFDRLEAYFIQCHTFDTARSIALSTIRGAFAENKELNGFMDDVRLLAEPCNISKIEVASSGERMFVVRYFDNLISALDVVISSAVASGSWEKTSILDNLALHRRQVRETDPVWKAESLILGHIFAVESMHGADFSRSVAPLVHASVGRLALKHFRQDIEWVPDVSDEQLSHVIDWLVSSVLANAPWLSNVDTDGIPKKLKKFGTFQALINEADKSMKRMLSGTKCKAMRSDEEVFADAGGDFYLVRLCSPSALDQESAVLRHCVGHGAYDKLLHPESKGMILSLRDRNNTARATIEVNDGFVQQFRGKANSEPSPDLKAVVVNLLEAKGIAFASEGTTFRGHFDPLREFLYERYEALLDDIQARPQNHQAFLCAMNERRERIRARWVD